jgi:hypothetical protein
MTENQMKDWREICQAFADKYGYKLLFVNEESCGVEMKDGSFAHIYADEMSEMLRRNSNVN